MDVLDKRSYTQGLVTEFNKPIMESSNSGNWQLTYVIQILQSIELDWKDKSIHKWNSSHLC